MKHGILFKVLVWFRICKPPTPQISREFIDAWNRGRAMLREQHIARSRRRVKMVRSDRFEDKNEDREKS